MVTSFKVQVIVLVMLVTFHSRCLFSFIIISSSLFNFSSLTTHLLSLVIERLRHVEVLLGELAGAEATLAEVLVDANALAVLLALLVAAVADALVPGREPVVEVLPGGGVAASLVLCLKGKKKKKLNDDKLVNVYLQKSVAHT